MVHWACTIGRFAAHHNHKIRSLTVKTRQFTLFFLSVALGLAVVPSGCSPAPVPAAASSPAGPAQVVEGFYRWYAGQPGNPLAGGAYRSSEYLSPDFVQKVDGIIASFDGGGYDPFLCAQDVPGDFTVGEVAVADQVASVVVRQVWNPGTEYELVRDLRVGLLMEGGQWKIADVCCGAPAATMPEQAVEGFYGWYLEYVGVQGSGQMRNPLADGAYRSSPYLTPGAIQKVDRIVASFDKGGYDPFLCAQDVPASYALDQVVVSGEEASVVVHTSFEGHTFTVELQQVGGRWAISDVLCAERVL